ncbi:MAG TPA: nitric oxide reductase transcriptional regulator NorR [Polyangiales bacterium]|nr:nitric oxide reductase transcriptional regulator NorR [Polyangiales bacterium]
MPEQGDRLLSLALDLTRSLATEDRYRRLLDAVAALVPCDAACLLRLDGSSFVPVATRGLTADTQGRRFERGAHPRLDLIAAAPEPIRFPIGSDLPDPFDGLLSADQSALSHVHACLGAPLRVEGRLLGLLTTDALSPSAFDGIEPRTITWLTALAGAAMHTSDMIERLEKSSQRMGLIAQDLMRSSAEQRGAALLGTSQPMLALQREIELVAPSDLTVLITGETGVGKELVARAIHGRSQRAGRPMIEVNCAALPASVAESELFGHVRGAFTGADQHRAGKLELAEGATLLLDEIGELPLPLQPKLLRALQQGEIQRVGSDALQHVDVRIVAATNRDLEAEVAAGRFRQDLYHRLNVYRIRVPPLRERRSDIALLAGHFCDQARLRLGLGPVRLDDNARARLLGYDWPGNVRELENTVQRAVLRASAGVGRGERVVVTARELGDEPSPGAAAPQPSAAGPDRRTLSELVDDVRRAAIRDALQAARGNWAEAARALGMHRSNLHHLATRLGLR